MQQLMEDVVHLCKVGLMFVGLMFLLTIFAILISEQKRIKCARVLRKILEVVFTHSRLSRMLLFHILHFIVRILTISIRRVQKYKQICDSECQGTSRWSGSECEEGSSRWSNELPDDIMQNVLQRLCLSDFFQCSAVCVSWKAIVDRAIASKSCRPTPELPWLMLCSHPFSVKDNCFLCLYDNAKLYDMPAPTYNMKRGDCVGSIEGWLIMADSVLWRPERFMKPWSFYLYDHQRSSYSINFFFLNPLTGARVTLPSSKSTLPCHCSNKPGFFLNVTASSVPTSHDCFVVSLCKNGHLAFCSPTQESWTLIDQGEARGLYFRDIEIIDGKLYAATTEASKFLMVFDVEYGNGSTSYRAERLVMLEPNMFIDFELISLAKDSLSEELFLIYCRTIFALAENPFPWHEIFGDDFGSPLKIQAFRVLKMEWKVNGPQWVEISDLGDRILFVAAGGNKMISTGNCFNYNGLRDKALQKNCIYFAYDAPCFDPNAKGQSFGVFSLANRSIKPIAFPKYHSFTRLHRRPVWFTPNPW